LEKLAAEINKVSTKIDAVEVLLKKPFKTWIEEENNLYGIEEQKTRNHLSKEKEQLSDRQELFLHILILLLRIF
jgi:hypothetical protein